MTLPNHIAIILDGNRRWARERHRPTFFGHLAGMKQAVKLVRYLKNKKVRVVTLYLFSSENWKRSEKEINYLMKLFGGTIRKNLKEFAGSGGQLKFIGDTTVLPQFLKKIIYDTAAETKMNSKFVLQLAINYGGRDEIIRAVNRIIQDPKIKSATEKTIAGHLDTGDLPDPDLIIRTSGEQRLSNFMLWQAAYSELYFAPEYLPDFNADKLDIALDWYSKRERRHGR